MGRVRGREAELPLEVLLLLLHHLVVVLGVELVLLPLHHQLFLLVQLARPAVIDRPLLHGALETQAAHHVLRLIVVILHKWWRTHCRIVCRLKGRRVLLVTALQVRQRVGLGLVHHHTALGTSCEPLNSRTGRVVGDAGTLRVDAVAQLFLRGVRRHLLHLFPLHGRVHLVRDHLVVQRRHSVH